VLLRDPQALDRLPEIERADWHSLWRDVEKLSERVANPNKDGQKPERRKNEPTKPSRARQEAVFSLPIPDHPARTASATCIRDAQTGNGH
jgi:hypothetical protein